MPTYRDIKLNDLNENIEDMAYIDQTLKLELSIPLGRLPFFPTKGATVYESIDKPMNAQTVASLQSGTYDALDGLIQDVDVIYIGVDGNETGQIEITPQVEYNGVVL